MGYRSGEKMTFEYGARQITSVEIRVASVELEIVE